MRDGSEGTGGARRARLAGGGRPRADRAAQFMPFAALTGYYELAREQERARLAEPRRELTEEQALALSRTISAIARGDLVRVRRYEGDRYTVRSGTVREVDVAHRVLRLGPASIPFGDIAAIERIDPT